MGSQEPITSGQIKPESRREHETCSRLQHRTVNLQPPRNAVEGYTKTRDRASKRRPRWQPQEARNGVGKYHYPVSGIPRSRERGPVEAFCQRVLKEIDRDIPRSRERGPVEAVALHGGPGRLEVDGSVLEA